MKAEADETAVRTTVTKPNSTTINTSIDSMNMSRSVRQENFSSAIKWLQPETPSLLSKREALSILVAVAKYFSMKSEEFAQVARNQMLR